MFAAGEFTKQQQRIIYVVPFEPYRSSEPRVAELCRRKLGMTITTFCQVFNLKPAQVRSLEVHGFCNLDTAKAVEAIFDCPISLLAKRIDDQDGPECIWEDEYLARYCKIPYFAKQTSNEDAAPKTAAGTKCQN